MKKKLLFILGLSLLLTACNSTSTSTTKPLFQEVDYVAQTKLNVNDTTKITQEVTVANYVDGDTTHFVPKGEVKTWISEDKKAMLKARYNSIDTPESTGKVEEWGKDAALYTEAKLKNSVSIMLQSDSTSWNKDSTAERYLVWVWYKPSASADYVLLNLELIQLGYAKLKSASNFSLYDTFSAANAQAMTLERKVYSNGKEKAEHFYYGGAQNISMKELRTNAEKYKDTKVSVEGLVTYYDSISHMAYAEEHDGEDDQFYGMNFYAGFQNLTPLKAGNRLRLIGTVSYYAPDSEKPDLGTWQVTGLMYLAMTPDYDDSMKILEKNVKVEPHEVTASFTENKNEESTFVKIKDFKVTNVYITKSDKAESNGAFTLTCTETATNKEFTIRTAVFKDKDGNLYGKELFLNKTITSAQGIVCQYDGKFQIKVFSLNDIVKA